MGCGLGNAFLTLFAPCPFVKGPVPERGLGVILIDLLEVGGGLRPLILPGVGNAEVKGRLVRLGMCGVGLKEFLEGSHSLGKVLLVDEDFALLENGVSGKVMLGMKGGELLEMDCGVVGLTLLETCIT